MKAELHTIWEYEDVHGYTLLDAWDEFTIDANPRGWEEALAKAKAGHEGEVRVVVVTVQWEDIERAFAYVRTAGTVNTISDADVAAELRARLNHPWRRSRLSDTDLIAAADAVHRVHLSWSRPVTLSSWRDCYECQTYACRALEATSE